MKLTIFLLLSLYSVIVNAQITDSITIIAVDNIGNTDTVVFGFAGNATDRIDNALGEKNILFTPLADLDLRLIQRDTITEVFQEWNTGRWDTVWINGCFGLIKPFPENADLKRDFRLNNWLDDHFILKIHGTNFPITIKIASVFTEYIVPYCIYDNDLNTAFQSDIQGLQKYNTDTIVTIENGEQPNLIGFRPWVILDGTEQPTIHEIKLYPNPGDDFIKIRLKQLQEEKILQVCNASGVIIDVITVKGGEYLLDISRYPSGIYFVSDKYLTRKFNKK